MLRISLLGEQVISDASGVARSRSARAVALVAFLVTHAGVPQTRQRLAATFWPDSTDEQALTNLRRELHHLRQVMADDASLVVTSRDLCWRDSPTCVVDVRVFEVEHDAALAAAARGDDAAALDHARNALAQYCGEFLPGSYDDWLLQVRAELERRCVAVCELLCDTLVRSGDVRGAVDAARRRVELRPLEEVGYRRLMEVQGDLGDRAGAVTTYHHCASVLERELGVEPDPATKAALQRLLARSGPATPHIPSPRPARERSGHAGGRLVGRSSELAVLVGAWQTTAAGRTQLVAVRGEAGVGKTRLVAELAEIARRSGAVVATAQCFGTSRQLALSPVADWLRAPVIQATLTKLDPVWRHEVERLVPSGKTRAAPSATSRAMVETWQRHRFFEGLARALIGVDRPMLLVLDNLHWCDQETLDFLPFCLGLTADAPILIAATVRDPVDDRGLEPALSPWTARMRSAGLLTDVALNPLDAAETTKLAEAITGTPLPAADADLLQATTGGFPLYVVEAARGALGPQSRPMPVGDLTAVLHNRFEQVSPAARDIAGLAAAVGRDFSLDLLTEASDLDADVVVRAVDELWRRRIVHEVGDGYDFSHDLLREAAYAQVSPAQRWLKHRRLAQGLELLHAHDPTSVAAQLADQYARGGRADRAVEHYRRAADVAAGRFAHGEAVRLNREALALVRRSPESRDRSSRELALLEAIAAPLNARFGYASLELRSTLERAITVAESLGRRDSTLAGLVGLWMSVWVGGDMRSAHAISARALAMAEPGSPLSGPAHFAYGGSLLSLGQPAEALGHFAYAATRDDYALSVGTRPDIHSRAFAAHAHWLLGDDAASLASSADAVARARSNHNPYDLALVLAYECVTHQLRDDRSALGVVVDELCDLCEQFDFAYYREWALVLCGWCRGGREGTELARRGVENLRREGSYARMPYWLALLADLYAREGRADAARATLDAALVSGQARQDLWWLPEVMRLRAAYDDEPARVNRLEAAAQLAESHGSSALVERCRAELPVG